MSRAQLLIRKIQKRVRKTSWSNKLQDRTCRKFERVSKKHHGF